MASCVTDLGDDDDFEFISSDSSRETSLQPIQAIERMNDAVAQIQREQQLMRNELDKQNANLVEQLRVADEVCETYKEKILEANNLAATLTTEIEERNLRIHDLKDHLLKAKSDSDDYAARLVQAEESIRYQGALIQHFQAEAVGNHRLTQFDATLASELTQRDSRIEMLNKQKESLEARLAGYIDEEDKWVRENDELRNMNAALLQQVEQDRLDYQLLQGRHEEEVSLLHSEIRRLRGEPLEDDNDVTFGGMQFSAPPSNNADGNDQHPPIRCDHCMLALANNDELIQHQQQCQHASVENID